MGRRVSRSYIVELLNQLYLNQENDFYFCMKTACIFCQTTLCFEEELREKNLIVKIRRWKIGSLYILRKIQIKLHYFLFKMEEKIVVKYYSTQYGKEPYKATEDAAGYDLFAAEARTLFPKSCTALTTEIKMAIPKGFYGKIFPPSGLLKNHFIACDGGVIDADYRGEVDVLMINHSGSYYTVRFGDRVAQIVLMKKYDFEFERVSELSLLGGTTRGENGFGSTGLEPIPKKNKLEELNYKNL